MTLLHSAAQSAPSIIVQPYNQSACAGGNATFFVQAEGDPPLGFQWRRDGTNIFDGVVSSPATSSLTVSNVQPADALSIFEVIVTNPFGQATSDTVRVTFPDPAILQQPANTVVPAGGTIFFGVAACGSPKLFYQWFFNDVPLTNSGRVFGAESPGLIIQNATQTDNGVYQVVVNNLESAIHSALARCVVAAPPVIVVQPRNQTICIGGNAMLSASATGSLPLSFFWQWNGTDVFDGIVSGPTNSSLLVTNVQPNDVFQVVVSNSFGQMPSDTAFAFPNEPAIFQQPTNTVVTNGGTIYFRVTACSDNPPIFYQWFKGSPAVPLTNGARISGADSNLLSIANAGPSDTASYQVVVHNPSGSVTSITAQCFVGIPPSVGNLDSRIVRFKSSTTFNPIYTGTLPRSYQWYRNDVPIPGAVNPTLTLNNIQRPEVGLYHVVVANGAGAATSAKAHLQVRITLESTSPIFREEATDELPSLTNAVVASFVPPPTAVFHGVPLLFSTYNATAQSWEASRCGVPPRHSMWVVYYSPREELTKVSTEGSSFNTVVAVYTWDEVETNAPVLIACNDNGGYDGQSSLLSFAAQARTDYYLAVDGVGGATGTARLQVGEIIRKPQFNPGNGSFRFEMAGPYWRHNTLLTAMEVTEPVPSWTPLLNLPATNRDWLIGYTNPSAASDLRRYYSVRVSSTNSPAPIASADAGPAGPPQ